MSNLSYPQSRGLPPDPADSRLAVIMPVFNEAQTVAAIVETVLAQPMVEELIAVDDGSSDGTSDVLAELSKNHPRLTLIRHDINQGKGAALRTGFSAARSPIVLIQDADLEYDPEEYPKMIGPILSGKADVVFGSRFRGSEAHRVLYFWHSIGNQILTLLSNMLTNLNLSDMETGFKAFRQSVVKRITIEENRFGFEPEITAKVARLGVTIYEVAISYSGRTYAQGKKVSWRDGLSAIRCIIKYNLLSSQ